MALLLTEPNEGRLELTPEAASQIKGMLGSFLVKPPVNQKSIEFRARTRYLKTKAKKEGGRFLMQGMIPGQMAFLIVFLTANNYSIAFAGFKSQ